VIEVKKEIEAINDRKDNLKSEINLLEVDKADLETDISLREKQEKDRLIPEIEKYEQMITDIHAEIA